MIYFVPNDRAQQKQKTIISFSVDDIIRLEMDQAVRADCLHNLVITKSYSNCPTSILQRKSQGFHQPTRYIANDRFRV